MALKIEYRIGIAAPVDEVYARLADIGNWPAWSPIHKKAEGVLKFGAPVYLEEYYEGLGTWETQGFVADWTPLSHIHISVPKPFYAGSLIRYFELEALSGKGSTFAIGALFNGFLSEAEGRRYRKFLKAGFETFAEALKTTAEADFALSPDRGRNFDPPAPLTPEARKSLVPKPPSWSGPKTFGFGKK